MTTTQTISIYIYNCVGIRGRLKMRKKNLIDLLHIGRVRSWFLFHLNRIQNITAHAHS